MTHPVIQRCINSRKNRIISIVMSHPAKMHPQKNAGQILLEAQIQYDLLEAPLTTNRKMLKMIGIIIKDDSTAVEQLPIIIDGLAAWNIFLQNTNTFTDEELYAYLNGRVLDTVGRMTVGMGMFETIDLSTVSPRPNDVSNRDRPVDTNANVIITLPPAKLAKKTTKGKKVAK